MVLNFLRHGSNTALILGCLAIAGAAAAGMLPLSWIGVASGALLFELTEYSTHRFMFHAKPSAHAWLRRQQHRLHYDHHAEPNRLDLLFLPLWYVVPDLLLVSAIAYLILRSLPLVLALDLGAMLALLHYEWVHFIAHQDYTPVTPWGRAMKRYHLRHHFVTEKLWYGVSIPFVDMACGTYRAPNDATRSRTTRVLYPGQTSQR